MNDAMSQVNAIGKKKVLVGFTGSVASTRFASLIRALRDADCDIKVVLTNRAMEFIGEEDIARAEINREDVYTDRDEWERWREIGDPVVHVDLAKWADVLLVAPLSANTLSKFANGLCDNLLTCIFRAWDFSKIVVIAPAMNTQMWINPFTSRHLETLADISRGAVRVCTPIEKRLACGDIGVGAMAEVSQVIEFLFVQSPSTS